MPMTNKEAYRAFCKTAIDLPIFMMDWYLDAVCENGDWEVLLVKEDIEIVAAMPFFLKRKWGFQYATMPLFVKYLGPYLIPEKRDLKRSFRLYEKLIEQLPKTDSFLMDCLPQMTNWLPFYWNDFQQTARYTYILNLENLEEVYQNFNRNIRRNIKKAKQNLTISGEEIGLEKLYEINKMSFERQGIPIYFSFEQFEKHDQSLRENNARKIFFAKDDHQNIHAVSYLIWDKKRAYYHLAGEHSDFRGSGASIFLTWEAIKFTKEVLGLQVFDFEGSMLKSIEKVRRQFGAVQETYFRIWRTDSVWLRVLDLFRK